MAVLDDEIKAQIREKFKAMSGETTLAVFKKDDGCEHCINIQELAKELAELSGKIKAEIYDMDKDAEKAREFGVENAPAIVFIGKEKRHMIYYGIPSGYEFAVLLQDIMDVSKGRPNISGDLEKKVKSIDFPVHIRVFVTPTCPYCPGAAKLAHDFAMLNPNIKGDVYEATEFREISQKYKVMGVPKTVINEVVELEGAYPPDVILMRIMQLRK